MDKSFNDDELSDIMKEIEALEDDFTASNDQATSPIMEELAHLDEEKSIPSSTTNIVSLESKRPPVTAYGENSTTMSFKVHGNLTLELKFDIGGKEVSLGVTESGLSIEMEGGAKFSIPLTEKSSLKKAV